MYSILHKATRTSLHVGYHHWTHVAYYFILSATFVLPKRKYCRGRKFHMVTVM